MRLRTVKLVALGAVLTALISAAVAAAAVWLQPELASGAALLSVIAAALAWLVYHVAVKPLSVLDDGLIKAAGPANRDEPMEKLLDGLKAMAARYDAVTGITGVAVFELDEEARVVYANRSAQSLLGQPPSMLEGRRLAEFAAEGSKEAFDAMLKDAGDGSLKGFDSTFVSASGADVEVRIRTAPEGRTPGSSGLAVAVEETGTASRLAAELARTRRKAERTAERLNRTISDLEEFALIAVRRELKMREIRERLEKASEGRGVAPAKKRRPTRMRP